VSGGVRNLLELHCEKIHFGYGFELLWLT
jgi:hypothetical protein